MDQAVLRAQVVNQFGRPGSPWLPRQTERLRPDLSKKTRQVLNICVDRLERSRTLEQNYTSLHRLCDLQGFLPSLPNRFRILKRSVQVASAGWDRTAQPPIGGAGRRMRDQLPGFDAEDKTGRRERTPFRRHFRGWRIVKRGLNFDYRKLTEVTRLGTSPSTASDQRIGQRRTGAHDAYRTAAFLRLVSRP